MGYLDAFMQSTGGSVSPEALTELAAQVTQQQSLIAAQQVVIASLTAQFNQLDTDAGLNEARIAAAEAVNTAQAAALAANEAVDTIQTAATSANASAINAENAANAAQQTAIEAANAVNALQATDIAALLAALPTLESLHAVDLRRFVPGGVLTNANISDAIDAAIVYAMANTGPGFVGPAPVIKCPAGVWEPTRKHVFPAWSTGQNRLVIGFVGESENETVFITDNDPTGTPLFTFGTGTTSEVNPWTMYLRIGRFSIVAKTEDACIGAGIRVYCAVNPLIERVRVRGLTHPNARWNQGRGIEILPATGAGVEINSQFAVIKDCDFSMNMTGIYVRLSYPILIDNTHAQGCHFHNAVFEGCMGEWRNSGAQFHGNTAYFLDRWYGGRNVPPIVTGFSRTTGLASGTGATVAAASGNRCLVTGMTGANLNALIDRGRWLELTPAGSSANELKVRGLYKIDAVVSATSCYIRKGSNHTSQAGCAFQVRESLAGTEMTFDHIYDEGHRVATYGFYRDNSGLGAFVVRRPLSVSVDYMVESDGPLRVRVEAPLSANTNKAARIWLTKESFVDAAPGDVEVDDFSHPGHTGRSGWQKELFGIIGSDQRVPFSFRDSGGGNAVRVRTALQELGFLEIWDARVTSSIAISGGNAQSITGLLKGSALGPSVAGLHPQYTANDALLGGPAIVNVAGTSLTGRSMKGTIAAAHLPTHPFMCTMFIVGRLESTVVTGAEMCRFQVSSADVSQFISFSEGLWIPSGNHVMNEGPVMGNALTVLTPAADVEPHAYVFGRSPDGTNVISTDNGEDYRLNNAAAVLTASHTIGQALNVIIGADGPTYSHRGFRWSIAAVKIGTLSHAEHRKLIDLSRNEWPLEA